MHPSPSEPDKYSIDEMMDRLKSGSSQHPEEGELVTRADGTQAIRVRKRKRRTDQPVHNERRAERQIRIFQVTAGLISLFLIFLVGGGAIIYANSKPFREGLLRQVKATSGAEPEIEQFRMNPKTANAGKVLLNWPSGSLFKQLTLHNVSAEISPSSFLGKTLSGDEISAATGSLELQLPEFNEATQESHGVENASPIQFSRYRIPVFQVTLGDSTAPLIKLSKSEVSLNTESATGNTQLSLYKGDVAIPNWPQLRLYRALVEFRENETEVVGLALQHESDSRGRFLLSGTVFPTTPTRVSSLEVSLDSFELSGITGPALGRLISARIDTIPTTKSNFLSFQPASKSSLALELSFGLSPSSTMELRGFPFLAGIADAMSDPWFQEPKFETDTTGKIERKNGNIIMRELDFENKARMACKGEVKMTPNQQLSGNLEIGLAEAMIVAAKNPRLLSLFGPTENGFRWLTLRIGGTATGPTDNFKELFEAAKTNPRGTPASSQDPGSTFEELTRPD
jgi:hypothetical protein